MRLDAIRERLEGLLVKRGRPGPFSRSWSLIQEPVELRADELSALLKRLSPTEGSVYRELRGTELRPFVDMACHELDANIERVAELAESREYPPFAHITWLWKVSEALQRISADFLTPRAPSLAPRAQDEEVSPPPTAPLRVAPEPLLPPLPSGPRLRGFAIDPLLDLAGRETQLLGRRRRLYEAARRVLLETAADTPLPGSAVQARVAAITARVREINQWQSRGVAPDIDLSHQIRRAVQRRDAAVVTTLLSVLQELAGTAQLDPELRHRIGVARASIRKHLGADKKPVELSRLRTDTFGETAGRAVERGCDRARHEIEAPRIAEVELVQAGSCVDGCFELGRSIAPVRVIEEQRRMAEVAFPTQTMVFRQARNPNDLPSALIGDPRLVLYELASSSLLARRYLAQPKAPRASVPRYSEARYYLIDGSGSMSGRRARMRDAILISELATMIRHLEVGEATARPVVYYRYFTKTAEPLVKASTIEEASTCIEALLVRKSRGETDIETALVASFAEIRQERERDPNLKRAQLVLISDGIAQVNLTRVWQAREKLGAMPVQVSVIALGCENPALKALAAWQRARGEGVFYHYLSDETLYGMVRDVRVAQSSTQLKHTASPPEPTRASAVEMHSTSEETTSTSGANAELWTTLEQLVDELCLLSTPPDLDELERAQFLEGAYEELELSLENGQLEAERARCDAQKRDYRSLALRFDRWFPEPTTLASGRPAMPPPEELLQVIEVVLLTVAELVEYLEGSPLARSVDAIEILERLLLEAGVSPWAYSRALPFTSPAGLSALARTRVSAATKPPAPP
ncbi:MAG: vWA domain-containing protein [Polyangiaceae bacterium]